jgi:hypothetical protein
MLLPIALFHQQYELRGLNGGENWSGSKQRLAPLDLGPRLSYPSSHFEPGKRATPFRNRERIAAS